MFGCISKQNISFPEEEFLTSEKCIYPTISLLSIGENIFFTAMSKATKIYVTHKLMLSFLTSKFFDHTLSRFVKTIHN